MGENYTIRQATLDDVTEVARVWAEGSMASLGFSISPSDYEEHFAKRIASQTEEFKLWIAEDSDGSVLGWQSLLPTRNNPAIVDFMAESSTYVSARNKAKGVGTNVMQHALKYAERTRLQWVIGWVLQSNVPMLRICDSLGWQRVGPVARALKPPTGADLLLLVYIIPPKSTG